MAALRGRPQRPHFNTRPRDNLFWQDYAACADASVLSEFGGDPRIFFNPNRYADALLVCLPCPVKEQCRLSRGGAEGVWGGKVYGGRKPRQRRAASLQADNA